MNYLREVLRDRRKSQRGSVLSSVLIIVAFLSIIAGAVMTELSTNFMISQSLVTRVANEATVNSAAELGLSQLQQTPLGTACPALAPVTLNGRTAAASYLSCSPVVDARSPQFVRVASSSAFTVDSTHVVLPRVGRDELLLADIDSKLRAYNFGDSNPLWSTSVEGILTGPPTAMLDVSESQPTILDLLPVTDPDDGSASPNCGDKGYCVAVLQEVTGSSPSLQCFMAAAGKVLASPAAGASLPNLSYFGDTSGTLYAYAPDSEDNCAPVAQSSSIGQPFVSTPVVFGDGTAHHTSSDEIYILASDSDSSQLVHFTLTEDHSTASLQLDGTFPLAAANAVGMSLDRATLPAQLAVTFAGGQVEVVEIQADHSVSAVATQSVGEAIGRAPHWCQCPSGEVIGVGAANGLYLYDSGLNALGSYILANTTVATSPSADSAGDWFLGADDGNVYEVVRQPGATNMSLGATFGSLGARVGSSVVAGGCPAGICVYAGLRDGNAFLIPIDARAITFTACLSTAPPACSGVNPRIWVRAEVGVAGSPQTVHITGWSYYSP